VPGAVFAHPEIKFGAPPLFTTFREAFEVEHDRVFDEFLLGAFGPGPGA
jgi:hypothetical protein